MSLQVNGVSTEKTNTLSETSKPQSKSEDIEERKKKGNITVHIW